MAPPHRAIGRLSLRSIVTPFVLVLATIVVWHVARSHITDYDRGPVNAVLNRANIQARLWEHVKLVVASTLIAIAVGIPSGIAMTRRNLRRATKPLLWF